MMKLQTEIIISSFDRKENILLFVVGTKEMCIRLEGK